MSKNTVFSPVPLTVIHDMVLKYKETMLDIAQLQINTGIANPSIVARNQYLQFYIDKEAFLRIQKFFDEPDCDCIGVFFGIDNLKNDKITGCFLGLTAQKEIIEAHFGNGIDEKGALLLGEENWPPPPENGTLTHDGQSPFFTVASKDSEIDAYFRITK